MDEKTLINIAAAAGKHRRELPPTYRPSVRDVCETSYSMGAKEWHAIGRTDGRADVVTAVIKALNNWRPLIDMDLRDFDELKKEIESLKTE